MTKYCLWKLGIEVTAKKTKRETALKMREFYATGATQGEVIRKFGRSEDTVRRIMRGVHMSIRDLDLPDISRPVKRELSDVDVQTAVELRKTGLSFKEIGRRLGIDGKTVSNHIHKAYETLHAAQAAMKAAEEARPRRQRETIFSWAAKWEKAFDERQVV
jgi:ATP/maltotriose-dependent transcriptional regulator MalT